MGKKSLSPLPAIYRNYFVYQQKYHQASDHAVKQSQRVLRAFEGYLKRKRIKLEALQIEHIDRFRWEFFKNFSDNTRRVYRSRLRGFLRYLYYERRILKKDLASLINGAPLFAQSKPPKFLRPDEVNRLFAGLKYKKARDLRAAAMVHLAYLLGLRPSEISLLKLGDIHFGKAEIRLVHRKNDYPMSLPLPEKLIKVIAAYLVGGRAESEQRNLFLTLHSPYRPVQPNTIAACIKRRMQAVGLPGTAYWLRHTYAQNLLKAGLSIYEVKEMLGHTSIESTRRYLHIHIKLMREVLFDEDF